MGSLWLKIKIWTKSIVFGGVVLYIFLFFLNNSGQPVTVWYWFFGHSYPTSMLVLIVTTFLAGVITTLLVRMSFTTVRQIRDLRQRNRLERLEREQADMKAKAAMLQMRTSSNSAPSQPPASDPSES